MKPGAGAEIVWDEWGVPHIYADDDDAASFAMGHAQARAHGTLLLEMYGIARGRAAAYWGEEFLDADTVGWTMGLPPLGNAWFYQQDEQTRARVAAFCHGINSWYRAHPDAGGIRRTVLPVRPSDVYAHYARNLFHFLQRTGDAQTQVFGAEPMSPPGSNAWAVAGHRSASGSALLVCSPHLPWSGRYRLFETHVVTPSRSFYGVGSVGLPWASMGFNDAVGWTHTVSSIDVFDAYRLELADDGYRFDGRVHPFDVTTRTILVRDRDGALYPHELTIRRTVHGPVVTALDGTVAAVRIAGLTVKPAVDALSAWWEMSQARSLEELVAAVHKRQLPMFNVVAAGREGRIAAIYSGRPPVRSRGTFADWAGWVPGNSSAWLWTDTHRQADLPQVIDPAAGFIQSTNDPPWTFTWPPALDAGNFPRATAPPPGFPGFRALAAIEPFLQHAAVGVADLVRLSTSTRARMADHVLDALVAAAGTDPSLREAGEVLSRWDRHMQSDSRGAALFVVWAAQLLQEVADGTLFSEEWSPDAPFTTPAGLRDEQHCLDALRRACATLRQFGQPLDAALGTLWRVRGPEFEASVSGGPAFTGVLKVLNVAPDEHGWPTVAFGHTFTAVVEFAEPTNATGLMVYDNWTEAGGPTPGRQLHLAATSTLRPILLAREAAERSLFDRENLDGVVARVGVAPDHERGER